MMTPTATAAMASATAHSMGGMSMGGGGCKISMLWNWNTVGACMFFPFFFCSFFLPDVRFSKKKKRRKNEI